MSSPPSLRTSVLLVLLAVATLTQAAILRRAIEAQKSIVEREEQMLDQAKETVQRKAQDAYDASRDAVTSVTDQLRYVVMYPWRLASEALEKPKLYAKYLLSKVPPVLSTELTTPASPTTVALDEDGAETAAAPVAVEEANRLPLLTGLQSFFTGESTEANDLPNKSPYVEIIEIKYDGPKVVSSQQYQQEEQAQQQQLPALADLPTENKNDVILA